MIRSSTEKANICVLGSTSAGNSTLVWNDAFALIVDFGLPVRYMNEHLGLLGLSVKNLSAALLTHVHSDHANESMLRTLFKEDVPVFFHKKIAPVFHKRFKQPIHSFTHPRIIKLTEEPFSLDPVVIEPFAVPHDSPGGCFGYSMMLRISGVLKKITIATDMGYPEENTVHHFLDSDIIIIESNHDVELLRNSMRPLWLKRRIAQIGHLSNDQCAGFIRMILERSSKPPQAIFLAHISQECNTNTHALAAMAGSIPETVQLVETHKETPSRVVTLSFNNV